MHKINTYNKCMGYTNTQMRGYLFINRLITFLQLKQNACIFVLSQIHGSVKFQRKNFAGKSCAIQLDTLGCLPQTVLDINLIA